MEETIGREDPFSVAKSMCIQASLKRKNVNKVDKLEEKTLRMFCFKY